MLIYTEDKNHLLTFKDFSQPVKFNNNFNFHGICTEVFGEWRVTSSDFLQPNHDLRMDNMTNMFLAKKGD